MKKVLFLPDHRYPNAAPAAARLARLVDGILAVVTGAGALVLLLFLLTL